MTLARVGDQETQRVAGFRIGILHMGIRRELRHRIFVRAAAAEQSARQREIGGVSIS